jgi:hypothetical protein
MNEIWIFTYAPMFRDAGHVSLDSNKGTFVEAVQESSQHNN